MRQMKVCRISGYRPDANISHSYDFACTPDVYAEEHLRAQVEEMAIEKFKQHFGDVEVDEVTWYDYPRTEEK